MRVCDVCKTEDDITPAELRTQDKPPVDGYDADAWSVLIALDLCNSCREHVRRKEWYILAQISKQVVIRPFLASEVRRAKGGDTGDFPQQG